MKVSFDGMGEKMFTFEAQTGVEDGMMVKLAAAGTVAACSAAGDVPLGMARHLRGGICGVQTEGYMKLPCAAGMAVGFGLFSSGADGKLVKGESGRPGFVVDVDAVTGACGVIF